MQLGLLKNSALPKLTGPIRPQASQSQLHMGLSLNQHDFQEAVEGAGTEWRGVSVGTSGPLSSITCVCGFQCLLRPLGMKLMLLRGLAECLKEDSTEKIAATYRGVLSYPQPGLGHPPESHLHFSWLPIFQRDIAQRDGVICLRTHR
jgi:hypothetical protein